MNSCVSYPFTKVKCWSDGCTSQFRSQFVFWLLTKYPLCMDISWSYFQAYHGKGAIDSLGDTVKWRVLQKVNANKIVITGPKDFAKFANEIINDIDVIFVDDIDFTLYEEQSNEQAQYVKGTLDIHHVQRIIIDEENTTLEFYDQNDVTDSRVERISLFWSGTICTQLKSLRWMSSYRKIKVYTQEPIFCPATRGVPDNEPSCPQSPQSLNF